MAWMGKGQCCCTDLDAKLVKVTLYYLCFAVQVLNFTGYYADDCPE